MLRRLRAVPVLAVALLLAGCADAVTSDGSVRQDGVQLTQIALAPAWSPSAATAYRELAAMSVEITSARILLSSTSGGVVLDTTLSFLLTTDTLAVQVAVRVQGPSQSFAATLELRDSRGIVQFARTQPVLVTAGEAKATRFPITLDYVGPGAAARTITVSPGTSTVAAGASAELLATAVDSAGRGVKDLSVRWTISDTSVARLSVTGSASAIVRATGRRGTVTITATGPSGLAGTTRLTFLPIPARLAVVMGGGQTNGAGLMLSTPFVVEVIGVDGLPIANQLVHFRAVTAGGKVSAASVTTDAAGRASTAITLGVTAGAYEFAAQSGTLPIQSITATATPRTQPIVFLLPITPLPSQITVGVAPPEISAQLSDVDGNPVRVGGVRCTLAAVVSPGGGTFSTSALSEANGVVRLSIPAYQGAPGIASITLTVDGVGTVATTTIKVLPRP